MNTLDVNIKVVREAFNANYNFSCKSGITGVFGTSGAGKTTLLNCLSGILKPNAGSISLNGKTLCKREENIFQPPHKRNIGYVFQEGRLFPHLSVRKNLLFGKFAKQANTRDFDELIDILELEPFLEVRPHQLSGGQRQRVAIGRALLNKSEALLLDEPFSALDKELRKQIISFLTQINNRYSIPILVVSHELSDLLQLSNTIMIIKDGEVIGHDEFTLLLSREEVFPLLKDKGLLNVMEMSVFALHKEKGIAVLSSDENAGKMVNLVLDNPAKAYNIGDKVKLFIKPEDISIALTEPEDISIQNRLQGKITSMFTDNNKVLCLVDVGMKVMVEVTVSSVSRLGLEKDKEVWILFKSVALDSLMLF